MRVNLNFQHTILPFFTQTFNQSKFPCLHSNSIVAFVFLDVDFVNGLKHRFQQVKIAANNIEDVYDGALYRQKFAHGGILAEPYNISVKLNTDGVAIFRSSQFGVWPLFLLVNELPPLMR